MTPPRELRKLALFAGIGLLSSACYFAVMMVCVDLLGLGVVKAAFLAFIVGTIISYFGNTFFTFNERMTARTATRFLLIVLVGMGLNLLIAHLLDLAGFHYALIALTVFTAVPALNYIGHRFWTYSRVFVL